MGKHLSGSVGNCSVQMHGGEKARVSPAVGQDLEVGHPLGRLKPLKFIGLLIVKPLVG